MSNDTSDSHIQLNPKLEALLPTLFIGIGALCLVAPHETTVFSLVPEYITSSHYSRSIGALLLAASLPCALRTLCKGLSTDKRQVSKLLLQCMALTALYIALFVYVGFFTATFGYVITLACLMDVSSSPFAKKLLSSIVYAGLTVLVLYFSFDIFKIYLPTTILP